MEIDKEMEKEKNQGRKNKYNVLALAAALLIGWGCTDDIVPEDPAPPVPMAPGEKREIGFTMSASPVKGEGVRARSTTVEETREIEMGGETLYINTLVDEKEGLDGEASADAAGRMSVKLSGVSGVGTRAKRVTKDDLAKFYVTAHGYTSVFAASSIWDGMRNVAVDMPSDGTVLWKPGDKDRYWPGRGTTLCFTAIANCDTTVVKLSSDGKSFTYTVPPAAQDQQDVLAAVSDELSGDYGQPVQLTFNHTLASIRFKMNSMSSAFTITKCEITGIPSTGTYSIPDSAWTVDATTADYATSTISWANSPSYTGDSTIVGGEGDANTFNVIPQTLPVGAKLKLTYTESGSTTPKTNEISIAGDKWEAGKIFTYYLTKTKSEYFLEVPASIAFDYTGAMLSSDPLKIRSYKHVDDGTATGSDVPLEWQMQVVASISGTDTTWRDATKADISAVWLADFTLNAMPEDITEHVYPAAMTVQPLTYDPDEHTRALRARTPVGTENNPRDLSLYDIGGTSLLPRGRTTANCYVVMQAGWYKIPMVYGNAIVDGATNSGAFTSTTMGSNILQRFVDHAGSGITQPWVSKAYSIDTVKIVWQDEWLLVTDVRIDGDYIVFHIDPQYVHQGNAVIAAYTNYQGGEAAAWSWHIWVTDNALTPFEMTNYQGRTYSFMPVDIGAVNGTEKKEAKARDTTILFRVVQKEGGAIVDATKSASKLVTRIRQTAFSLDTAQQYSAVFYQWGRKDPIIPTDGIGHNTYPVRRNNKPTQDKHYYGPDGYMDDGSWSAKDLSAGLTGTPAVALYIRNPGVMDTHRASGTGNVDGWMADGTYMNLWSANASSTMEDASVIFNDNKVVKTVYDPSPTGYVMPPGNAFTGASTDGENHHKNDGGTDISVYRNANWQTTTRYMDVYAEAGKTGDYLPMYTIGQRHPRNGIASNDGGTSTMCGQLGRKWLSVAWSGEYGINFVFGADLMQPKARTHSRGFGFTVMPVREDSPAWGTTIGNYVYQFAVDGAPKFNGDGAYQSGGISSTDHYSVLSYRTNDGGATMEALPWTVVGYAYSDDGGSTWTDNGTTRPAWLTAFTHASGGNGTNTTTPEYGTAVVRDDFTDKKALLDNQLKNATARSNWDLSTHNVKGATTDMNTANCYVISAPGTYRLPLVYGNAFKNGQDNPTSYANCVGSSGATITSPWIKNNGAAPATAAIVWSDLGANIVQNLAVSGDYLTFSIGSADIGEGNAVVCVKDASGTVLWSWHLWFTTDDVLEPSYYKGIGFMKGILGLKHEAWVAPPYTPSRIVRISVRQGTSLTTRDIYITQNATGAGFMELQAVQFGRRQTMHPFPTSDGYYTPADAPLEKLSNAATPAISVATQISKPNAIYAYNSNTYFTMASYRTSSNGKMIFDPCPVGYRWPYNTTINTSFWNTPDVVDTYGRYYNGDIFFPYLGNIVFTNSATGLTDFRNYNSFVPNTQKGTRGVYANGTADGYVFYMLGSSTASNNTAVTNRTMFVKPILE